MSIPSVQFRQEYARHRASEGRALRGEQLRFLPYLGEGPLAQQWAIRARSFDVLAHRVVNPMSANGPIDILDLGAGNGWLCHRVALSGHRAVALDIRDDEVDGLGAATDFLIAAPALFRCVKASFDALPFGDKCFDLVLFNASLHYATDLRRVLREASRVTRSGGCVAILDSPFYRSDDDGEQMVAEKRAQGASRFGTGADILLAQDFIEYLTPERLAGATPALSWTRHRVRYPLRYEMRPLFARLRGKRRPSRFDVWTARLP